MKYEFDANFPAEVRASVQAMVAELEWLVPKWCQLLIFEYCNASNNESAACTTNYAYRWAKIEITGLWLMSPESRRREDLIHEMIHISTAPLADYARETIKLLLESDAPKFHQHAQAELSTRHELAVQELAQLINEKVFNA